MLENLETGLNPDTAKIVGRKAYGRYAAVLFICLTSETRLIASVH
jgi:hypothetical protein